MSTTTYFNFKRTDVKNQEAGYRNIAYFAKVDQFTTIAAPDPAALGSLSVTIATDHAFTGAVGTNGFYKAYCLPNKNDAPGESTGEEGAKTFVWKPKIFIPGDTPDVAAMVKALVNEDVILLLQDANCPNGGLRQYGNACYQAQVEKTTFTSGVTKSGTTKGWEIEFSATSRAFYNGTVALFPDA